MANARSVIINLVANDRVSETVKGVGKQFDKLNQKLKDLSGPAMTAAGAAAGAAFASGLAGAVKLDSARGRLEAQLGLTKEQSKVAGDVAGKLYASAYGESMEDVQTAITSVIQNMDGMRDASASALQQITARAMDVATVMDEEVGSVTRAVSQMMRTGLAKNAQEAFDIITRGTQLGANKAQDLLDTFNEYGTQFRNLGLSGKQAMGLIAQGLQAGARDADVVADTLKEFSIEAVAGSKRIRDAYKELGIDADKMFKMLGQGGPAAAKALDITLDRLRAVEDPVERNALAVEFFGTKAEDLGQALYALDPSSAVKALGDVSGAADQAGKALHETTEAKFKSFVRTLQQDAMGAVVGIVGWFQQHTTVAKVLAGAVATLTGAYAAYNVATAIAAIRTQAVTKGTVLNTIVTKTAAAATRTWAAATWVLNAALRGNPIVLVVTALTGLVAGLVLAYRRSETFRGIVQSAWSGIQSAASTAWRFLQGVLSGIWGFITSKVIPVFQDVWAVVRGVWTGIVAAIRVAWSIIQPIFNFIATVIRGVLVVAFIFLRNLVKIVWIGIQVAIKVAWLAIKGIFLAIKAVITGVLAPAFKWLYNNSIKPGWEQIKKMIAGAWNFIRPIWERIRSWLAGTLGPAFKTFASAAKSAWDRLKSGLSAIYNNGIKPVFDRLKQVVNSAKTAFSNAVDYIKRNWDRLKDIAKKPVNFVIGLYNKGIVALVNKLASFVGVKTRLDTIPTFARGGVMPGYAPGRDSLLAAVSPGESIFRPEFTRAVGAAWVHRANEIARRHGPAGVRRWLTGPDALGGEGLAFARGGIVPYAGAYGLGGVISGFVKGVREFAVGNLEKAARSVLGKIFSGSMPGGGIIRTLISALPGWITDRLVGWIKGKVSAGGPGVQRALAFAKREAGKPYVWGGVGPHGYDCSGFMSAITNVIKGRPPHSRLFTTHSFGAAGGPGGFVRNKKSAFMVGVTDAGVGHMAGTLAGHDVESSGSAGVRFDGGARGANHPMFSRVYGLTMDQGGVIPPKSWSLIRNNTRRSELVLTGAQQDLLAGRTGGQQINVTVNVPPTANLAEVGRAINEALRAYKVKGGRLVTA